MHGKVENLCLTLSFYIYKKLLKQDQQILMDLQMESSNKILKIVVVGKNKSSNVTLERHTSLFNV